MAITTWTELKASVADFADRPDLTSQIIDFITLAEARLNDMLLLKDMEQEDPLTAVINQNYIALPAGFVSPIAFWLVISTQRFQLEPALPQELMYSPSSTQPLYFAIDGVNIRFDCPADQAYSCKFRYIKQSNLGASVATNYLLTKRPDIYLAGSLVELSRYTRDVDLFNTWEPRFLKACADLKASDNRNRAIVPLRTDIPGTDRSASIIRGY